MSDFTIFRDQVEQGLGFGSPEQAAKTSGSLIRSQTQAQTTGNPSAPPQVNSWAAGIPLPASIKSASVGGMSVLTLAAIGLGAFLLFKAVRK